MSKLIFKIFFFVFFLLNANFYCQTSKEFRILAENKEVAKDFQTAYEYYTKAISLDSLDTWSYYRKGAIDLLHFNNKEIAIFNFSKAISIDSNMFRSYLMRAYTYKQFKDYYSAIKDYRYVLKNIKQKTAIGPYIKDGLDSLPMKIINIGNDTLIAEAITGLGICYFQLKDYESSIPLFKDVLGFNPKDALALISVSTALYLTHDYDAAEKYLQEGIKYYPTDAGFLSTLGDCLTQQHKYKEALVNLNKAIELDPNPRYFDSRGYNKFKLGDFEGALKDINYAIEKLPRYSYSYRDRALLYFQQNKYSEACNDLYKLDVLSFKLTNESDLIEFKNKYCKKAENSFKEIATKKEFEKDFNGAYENYCKAISFDSLDSWLYYRKGVLNIYFHHKIKEGISDLSKAITLNPYNYNYQYNKMLAYSELKDYTTAIKEGELTINNWDTTYKSKRNRTVIDQNNTINLQNTDSLKNLFYNGIANCYLYLGDNEKAISNYLSVLKSNPKHLLALAGISTTLFKIGKPEESLFYSKRGMEYYPNIPEFYFFSGSAYNEQGKYKEGLSVLNIAIELNPNRVNYYAGRGFSKYNLKDIEGALTDLNYAISKSTKEGYAYETRALIYFNQNKYNEACNDLNTFYKLGYMVYKKYPLLLEFKNKYCK